MISTRVECGGARLFVVSAGPEAGVPLVFLHAGVADHRMWRDQLAALPRATRTVAFDRRGFGQTSSADEPFDHVTDTLAVLDALVAGPAVLIGCSQGGRIAVDLALAHPEQVRQVLLIAPAISGWPDPETFPDAVQGHLDALERAEEADDLDQINAIEAQLWLDGPTSEPGRVGGAARALFVDMNGRALRAPPLEMEREPASAVDRLATLPMPVSVACGTLDFPHVQQRCQALAERWGTRVHGFERTAHLPSLERPKAVNAWIVEQLRSHAVLA